MFINKNRNLIKKILREKKLSQKEFSKIIDSSEQYISDILLKKRNVGKNLLKKIFEKFPEYSYSLKELELPDVIDYKYIEYYRKYYNLSQIEMSIRLNISQTYYSRLIKEKLKISSKLSRSFINMHKNNSLSNYDRLVES